MRSRDGTEKQPQTADSGLSFPPARSPEKKSITTLHNKDGKNTHAVLAAAPPSSPHRSGASRQRLGSSRVSPRACHSRQAGLHVFPFFVPVRVLVQDTEKLASSRRSNRTEWAFDITLIYIVWHFHFLFFCLFPSYFLDAETQVCTLLPLFCFSSLPFPEQVYKYFLETLLHLFFCSITERQKNLK